MDTRTQYEEMRQRAITEGDDYTRQYAESKLAELDQTEARLQAQQADLEDIQLPIDYSDAFGDPRANDEIKNLLRQVKEQLYTIHNEELLQVKEDCAQKLQVLQASVQEITSRNDSLQTDLDAEKAAHGVTKGLLQDEILHRQDAEQKRDNAVQQAEEATTETAKLRKENESLKAQVDELEGMVRTYKKPAPSGGLQLTSTLKPESEEEKKARLEKERVDTINRNLERRGLEPLKLPGDKPADTFQDATAANNDAAGGSDVADPAPTTDGNSQGQAPDPYAQRFEALERRVADLEAHFENGLSAAV